MERIKSWIRIFFGFSRTETNGFLILLPLMTVILFSEPAYRWYRSSQPQDFSADAKALDSLMAQMNWNVTDSVIVQTKKPESIPFISFDPNRASEKDFTQLGLSNFLIKRILRYREKGGIFRKKEDVLKIYGMDSSWYRHTQMWMTFETRQQRPTRIPSNRQIPVEALDINEVDSMQLLNVYGIGPVLSKRIRTFRDRLGGILTLDQLHEVYGLDSSVVREMKKKFIVKVDFVPRKIQLNKASLEELIGHPYIKRKEGQAILSYRLQHGAFVSFEQLAEIKLLTTDWISRVQPYLALE